MGAFGQNINLLMTSNKGNLFVFEVGSSVKFVSAIKDAIFRGPRGVWQKTYFLRIFFRTPSLLGWIVKTRGIFWEEQTRIQRGYWKQDAGGLKNGVWISPTSSASSPFVDQTQSFHRTLGWVENCVSALDKCFELIFKGSWAQQRFDADWRWEVIQMPIWFKDIGSDRHQRGGKGWIPHCLPSRGGVWRAHGVA